MNTVSLPSSTSCSLSTGDRIITFSWRTGSEEGKKITKQSVVVSNPEDQVVDHWRVDTPIIQVNIHLVQLSFESRRRCTLCGCVSRYRRRCRSPHELWWHCLSSWSACSPLEWDCHPVARGVSGSESNANILKNCFLFQSFYKAELDYWLVSQTHSSMSPFLSLYNHWSSSLVDYSLWNVYEKCLWSPTLTLTSQIRANV